MIGGASTAVKVILILVILILFVAFGILIWYFSGKSETQEEELLEEEEEEDLPEEEEEELLEEEEGDEEETVSSTNGVNLSNITVTSHLQELINQGVTGPINICDKYRTNHSCNSAPEGCIFNEGPPTYGRCEPK